MKISQKIFLMFLLATATGLCAAQETTGAPNELDKLYTPGKNSILNGNVTTNNTNGKFTREAADIKNSIKFNPFLLARSTFAVLGEHRLTDGITIQSGLGFIYNKDVIMSSFTSYNFLATGSDLQFSYILNTDSKYISGPYLFFPLSFRFYYTRGGYYGDMELFNSIYFEMGLRYNSFKVKVPEYYVINGSPNVKIRSFVYYMNMGYQFSTEGKLKTTHDFYVGFGLRSSTYDSFSRDYYNSSYTRTGSRQSALTPSILMGYAFGIGFKNFKKEKTTN